MIYDILHAVNDHLHAVNYILAHTLRSVNMPAMLEPPGFIRGDGKRASWHDTRSMVWM